MKEEEIKIRIVPSLKRDFQDICENEQTTMSNKINTFIFDEVKNKKPIKHTYRKQLIKLDVRNTNGRLYKKDELLKSVFDENGFEYTELDRLNNKKLYGQFGHSDETSTHQYNATHYVSNLRIDEDWLIGDVTILNNSILPILDNLVFRIIGFDAILKSEDTFK